MLKHRSSVAAATALVMAVQRASGKALAAPQTRPKSRGARARPWAQERPATAFRRPSWCMYVLGCCCGGAAAGVGKTLRWVRCPASDQRLTSYHPITRCIC